MAPPSPRRTVFDVPKMDCPSEERLIRMSLDGVDGVAELRFDLGARRLVVLHRGAPEMIGARIEPLGLGARLVESVELTGAGRVEAASGDQLEARTLRWVLAMNASMFAVELVAGLLAESTGLLADSLDMLADAGVYGLSLYAVGRTARLKLRAAHLSGWMQATLAALVLADVTRRLLLGSSPEAPAMIGVSLLALGVNVTSLLLLSRHREGGAHMRASVIFSTTDVIANLGVIVAGGLVGATGSPIPDLAIGAAVALLVLSGAVRILKLR